MCCGMEGHRQMFPRQTKRTETGVGVGMGFVDSVLGVSSSARPTSEALPFVDVEVCMLGYCCVRVEFGGVRGELFRDELVPSTRHSKWTLNFLVHLVYILA
jgi:hypothetical protein